MNGVHSTTERHATDWLERTAVAASMLCLVHCIGLPLVIAALPALVTIIPLPETFHVWVLGFAVPASGAALGLGLRGHGIRFPLAIGIAGLALLSAGALLLTDQRLETLATIIGSALLAVAHILNWRRRHARHSHG